MAAMTLTTTARDGGRLTRGCTFHTATDGGGVVSHVCDGFDMDGGSGLLATTLVTSCGASWPASSVWTDRTRAVVESLVDVRNRLYDGRARVRRLEARELALSVQAQALRMERDIEDDLRRDVERTTDVAMGLETTDHRSREAS